MSASGDAETFAFHCNACGNHCNLPPAMTVENLLHHERRFIGCLTVRIVEQPSAATRLPGGVPLPPPTWPSGKISPLPPTSPCPSRSRRPAHPNPARQGELIETNIAGGVSQGNKDHRAETTAPRHLHEHYREWHAIVGYAVGHSAD